jgi:hypothetical protein
MVRWKLARGRGYGVEDETDSGAALPATERSSEPARSRDWYAGPTQQRVGRRASARKEKKKKTGPRRENRDWAENEVRAQLGALSLFLFIFLLYFYFPFSFLF